MEYLFVISLSLKADDLYQKGADLRPYNLEIRRYSIGYKNDKKFIIQL